MKEEINLQEQLKNKDDKNGVWKILNAPFSIWLFSAIFFSFIPWSVTKSVSDYNSAKELILKKQLLQNEIEGRITQVEIHFKEYIKSENNSLVTFFPENIYSSLETVLKPLKSPN